MVLLRLVDWLNDRLGRLVALLLLPSIAITLYEVAMRYLFNSPTVWVNESVLILFGFYFLLGGAYALRHRGHVRVDVLLLMLPPRAQRTLEAFAQSVTIFFLAIFFWMSGAQALDSIAYLERSDSAWGPYIFPVLTAAPLAAALMILQALGLLVRAVLGVEPGADEGGPDHGGTGAGGRPAAGASSPS